MIRLLIKLSYQLAVLVLFLSTGVLLLLSNPEQILKIAASYLPGQLKIEQAQGNFWETMTLKNVNYDDQTTHLRIKKIHFTFNWPSYQIIAQWQDIKGSVESPQGLLKGTLKWPQIQLALETPLSIQKTSKDSPFQLQMDALVSTVNWHWTMNGQLQQEKNQIALQGQGQLIPFNAYLDIASDRFPLINNSEYQIEISPQLKLQLSSTQRELTGTVLVPKANIKLQSFTNSISLPDEVVYKKQSKQDDALEGKLALDIEMGEDVRLDIKGLKGQIEGVLHVQQESKGMLNAYGELSIYKGTYKAYGQELSIQQGELLFTGGSINNPGIQLRAIKKINNTPDTYSSATQLFDFNTANLQSVNLGDTLIVGVEVSGRLLSPKIKLFSEPAILSQADILSMLVLGRPANQANKAGGQLLLAAISSMNIGGASSNQLLEQLKQSSGLDFNVQTNSNYNQLTNTVTDSTALVVGKSLSKRMYLSYNIGLAPTDSNMLTLKYLLNQFFSIQVSNSDTSSAIDLLYTSPKKKAPKHITRKKS